LAIFGFLVARNHVETAMSKPDKFNSTSVSKQLCGQPVFTRKQSLQPSSCSRIRGAVTANIDEYTLSNIWKSHQKHALLLDNMRLGEHSWPSLFGGASCSRDHVDCVMDSTCRNTNKLLPTRCFISSPVSLCLYNCVGGVPIRCTEARTFFSDNYCSVTKTHFGQIKLLSLCQDVDETVMNKYCLQFIVAVCGDFSEPPVWQSNRWRSGTMAIGNWRVRPAS
jgi:hypothetical protein